MFHNGMPTGYLADDIMELIRSNVTGRKRRQYAMALNLLDTSVKSIYNAVEEAGQLPQTYFIFASDNGGCWDAGGSNGPLRGTKGTLYEGGTKSVSFVHSNLLPDDALGTTYTGLAHISDWFPTILDWANITYTPSDGHLFDGISQADAIATTEDTGPRESMLYNYYINVDSQRFDPNNNAPLAFRIGRLKLMHAYLDDTDSQWYDYDAILEDDDTLNQGTCCQASSLFGNII